MTSSEEFPEELERYWRGPTGAGRTEMLEAIGEDERFLALTKEQQASVFRAMFDVRFYMDAMKRVADGRMARMLERGPRTIELALQHLVEMRYSAPMGDVLMRLPNSLWNASSTTFFEFAQAMLEASRSGSSNPQKSAGYIPSVDETLAQAQLEEARRLRGALAVVSIRDHDLIGKMCRYTSGKAIGKDAIKKRFTTRD